jgi:Arc/MetJ family transcription regulator
VVCRVSRGAWSGVVLVRATVDVYYLVAKYTFLKAAMRTNIEIDDALMERALKISGLPTKKAAVEEGLRLLIRMREQGGVRELFGKIPLSLDLDRSRQGRRF